MAGSVNKVILIGHLGRDPEIRPLNSGTRVCNLSIATAESWRDKHSGERKEKTEWHRIVIFNDGLVTVAEKYPRKGAKVYLEGQFETRKWQDQSGQDRYSTEIVLKPFRGELTMLDGRQDSAGAQASPGVTSSPAAGGTIPDAGPDDYLGSVDHYPAATGGARSGYGTRPADDRQPADRSQLVDDEIPF